MRRLLVPVLLVALGLTGCSGSGSGGGGSAKSAYLAKAEAACTKANADLAALKKSPPTSVAGVPAYVHRIVDVARGTVSTLTGLIPPAADATALKAKLSDPLAAQLRTADSYAAKVDAAAAAKDQSALLQLVTHPPTRTEVDLAFLRSYGFSSCVRAADTANATK